MGKYRTRELTQRVRYALLAGVAGAFLIPQVAAAAPTGEHDYTTPGVSVDRSTANTTKITSTATNNVINWRDYSVNQGETVQYDGGNKTNNYLNIVTGANTSNINGRIEGGKNVYIVNPNGVIFGKTASVNVGNLYVSTQDTSTVNTAADMANNVSPLSASAAGLSDVVNMGSITANKVEVHGKNIRFLNAANVTATDRILYTDTANGGYAHIGYRDTVPTHYKVNPTTTNPAGVSPEYYQLVKDKTELDAINNSPTSLAGNYMLENDIDFYDSVTGTKKSLTPIGGDSHAAFSGKFDGNFFRIQNFTVSGTSRAGAFGETNGARIDNVGITGATITGGTTTADYAGGVVGYATSSTLKNVYSDRGTTVSGAAGRHGGIAGYTSDTTIESAYSKATIGAGGGIIGNATDNTKVTDTYSEVISTGYTGTTPLGAWFIYNINPITGPGAVTVDRAYYVGDRFSYSNVSANIQHVYKINKNTINSTYKATIVRPTGSTPAPQDEKEGLTVGTYTSEWGNAINNTGAPGAKWRIYEGRTLPLLTAFMDGTATATYDIRYFNANGTLNSDGTNTAKSNNGADITTGLTYNSQYVKIVGKASGADVVGGKSNVVTYAGAMQYNADGTPNLDHIYDYVSAGTNDFDKTNGIRNAGTKAILWSDQDGPNLRGVNVTIGKRKVDMTVDGHLTAERQYKGKLDVKDAFIEKLLGGGISTPGFTSEDADPNHPTVSLNTTGFTATMVDKHVGTGKVANFGGSITLSGEDAGNYDFDGNLAGKKGKVDIYKAPLLLSFRKKKADDRVYDGTSIVRDDAMKQSVSPGNISINTTIAAGSRGEVMTDETGTADVLALADITDPIYTDKSGNEQIHQGAHKLQYTNVKLRTDGRYDSGQDYELYYTPEDNHEVAVTNDTVYLDGRIIRRQIKTGDFKVYHKNDNSAADATKVYDGTATYDLNSDIYLSSNVGATDDDTGVVARDQGHITFLLQNGTTATFMTDEPTPSETKNVKTAKKIAYKVHADADTHTDGYGGHLLDDYWVVNDKDTALTESTNFNATGKGTITPKALTATVVKNHITKVYDGWTKQTDGNRTRTPGKDLVTISGYVAGDSPRTNISTADYASPNVVWDATNQTEKAQNVTYHVSFDRGTGDESENYILDANATGDARYGIELTQDSAGKNYTGTITPRPISITMGTVDKIYDGTAVNTKSNITGLAGTTAGDTIAATVLADDGITAATLKAKHAAMLTAGTAHSSFGRGTGGSFAEDVNASNGTEHDVRYQNVGDVLQEALAAAKKHNYTIDDTIYGKGTINRRLIEKSGFQVRDKDGGIANATKVYDGTSTFQLKNGETLVAKTAATGSDTGVVAKDKDNIFFTMTGDNGHFTSDAAGANHTSHKSEAKYAAYSVIADSHDKSVSPLTNYYFGTSGTDKRDLETVNADTPDAVTASGRITPAKIRATTHAVEKVYDGVAEHTDGSRNIKRGSDIVSLAAMITDETDGQPTNTSTARYADKNVSRDGSGNIINKDVTYTAQLTGQYADDYQIVDAGNNVISTVLGSGANKTLTANAGTVTNAGKITPRKLNIKMGDVSKTYDGTSTNTDSSVTEITDAPQTSVIGTILTGDGITTGELKTAWDNMRSGGTASSSYGNGTGSAFHADANASNGTPHDVRYTKMDEAFKDAFGTMAAGNYTVDKTVYGKGTINRKAIDPNNFDIVDAHGNASHATKVYDGTSNYTVPSGWNLRPSTGHGTGVITADEDKINFAIDPNKGAHFTKADNTTRTANAYEATRVAYNVKATTDQGYEYLLKNYTLNGKNLESGEGAATGAGTIERRTINIALAEKENIDKVYDGSPDLVDGTVNGKELHHSAFVDADAKANVVYATGTANDNKLVRTKNGAKVDDNAVVTVAGSYADKNVARNPAREIIDKVITYNVSIGDNVGKNYTLSYNDGTTTHTKNAEEGLSLSAKGTITPKDLSGAFAKITKVYDGTPDVDHTANPTVTPAQVGFTAGAVIAGDDVTLATHNEAFQSKNVNGDGTKKNIDGTEQKNWINYTNVTLAGADAGNYELKPDTKGRLYGLGEIKPFEIDDNTPIIYGTITPATKTYDGTRAVKKLVDGVESAKNEDVKGYIQHAYITLGTWNKDLIDRMNVDSATYDTKDAASTQKDVTYNLKYDPEDDGNIIMKPGTQVVKAHGKGTILKRDVTVTVKNPLTKVYDAGKAVKDASGNIITGDALNDLVTLDGLTKDDTVAVTENDNTTYTTKAVYVDTDAGTGDRHVKYTITLNSNAGNYNLIHDGGSGNAFSTGDNTITKRRVDVKFKDPTSPQPFTRPYNGSARNTFIYPYVSEDDAAVLTIDAASLVNGTDLVGLTTGISSTYVKDDKMTPDPNVGKNKYIRFDGVDTALGTALAGKVANYTFTIGSATGEITKRTITKEDLKKGISFTRAEKEYDATKDIVNAKGNLEHAYILDGSGNPLVDDTGATIDLKDFFDIDNARTHYNVTENADTNPQSVTYGLVYRGGANPNLTLGATTFDMTGTGYGGSTIDGIIKRRVLQIGVLKDKDVDKIYDTTNTAYNGDLDHAALATRTSASNIGYAAGATEKQKIVDNAKVHVDAVYDGTDVIRDTDPDRTVKKNVRTITYKVRIDGNAGKNYQLSDGTTTVDAEDAHGLPLSATGAITPRRLTLSFAAGDSKQYDGSAKYLGTTKTINNIDVDDTDGKGNSTITTDDISAASFDLTDVVGLYGTGNTDAMFKKDANAGSKTIQYSKLKNTLKNTPSHLHNKDNYDVVDTGYGAGAITKRTLTEDEWRQGIHFDAVTKEYDGTEVVKNNGDASAEALKKMMDRANVIIGGNVLKDDDGKPIDITADLAVSVDPHKTKYNTKNVVDVSGQPRVTYTLTYSGANFEPATFTKTGEGTITPRRIYADVQDFHPVKVYDKNDAIVGSVKDDAGRPLTEEDLQKYAVYRHYVDPTTGDPQDTKAFVDVDATPHMTAKFSDEKVAWKDGSWRNTPQGDAKDVVYAFSLSGASAAENYEFVDQDGNPIMQSVTGTTRSTGERPPRADGRIDPYRIELRGRSEPYEIRVNEAVPSTFDGSPIGRNYSTPLGESLDGEISYRADVPAKGPRWGIDYPIYGHYQPGSGVLYQNYYFDSVPGTLRVNTYVPDYEYYKAMTQVSKMTPDEYAYENASLDRTNHYSRKPTAQVDPVPPAINVVKDGVDIRQNDINVLDDTVYTIVDEVFG